MSNYKIPSLNREEIRTLAFSFSQYGEDIVVYNLLQGRDPAGGYFVDVGCFHPFHISTTNLLYRHGWRGVNIDIDQEKLELFDRWRPEDTQVHAAVYRCSQEMLYLKYCESYCNRLITDPNSDKKAFGKNPVSEEVVKTKTLDEILDGLHLDQKRFDYLNIDCEGNDLDVLKGMDFNRYHPYVITIEANSVKKADEIFQYLADRGYRFVCRLGVSFVFMQRQS